MYTVTSAARIKSGSFVNDARNAAAVPWKSPWMLAGMFSSFLTRVDRVDGIPQRSAGREIERNGDDGELPLVVDGNGDGRLLRLRERRQW